MTTPEQPITDMTHDDYVWPEGSFFRVNFRLGDVGTWHGRMTSSRVINGATTGVRTRSEAAALVPGAMRSDGGWHVEVISRERMAQLDRAANRRA